MEQFVETNFDTSKIAKRLWINKIFGLLTLGFYRFAGKTHLRRILWQGVRVNGERLTYHGTAMELFIGFVIAMVLLSIAFIGLEVLFAFLNAASPSFAIVTAILNYALLFFIWNFARYRLWRYRMSRTSLRTVRFYQRGAALKYASLAAIWTLITMVTVGLAYPIQRYKLAKYQIDHMSYGAADFTFHGNWKSMFSIYIPQIITSVVITVVMVVASYMIFGNVASIDDPELYAEQAYDQAPGWYFILLAVSMFIGWLVLIVTRIIETKYLVAHSDLDGTRFSFDVPTSFAFKRVLAISGKAIAMIAVAVAVFAGLIYVTSPSAIAFVVMIAGGFLLLVFLDIIKVLYLLVPVVEFMSRHIRSDNSQVFVEVAKSSENSPKYGEGFADALDVGAF